MNAGVICRTRINTSSVVAPESGFSHNNWEIQPSLARTALEPSTQSGVMSLRFASFGFMAATACPWNLVGAPEKKLSAAP